MAFKGEVSIILVDPLYGGNVGSVARAMANFGLEKLTLVRPAEGVLEDKMLAPMARGQASHIIEGLRVVDDLSEAIAEVELAMGFTTRLGKKRCDGMDLGPAMESLLAEVPRASIAGVFGSEDKGLSNEDLEKCHWLVRIPTAPALSSLNLSQAVCLFAWELFKVRSDDAVDYEEARKVAPVAQLEGFYSHLEEVLDLIGFIHEENPARMMNAMRRIFSRRLPDERDVRILRGFLSKVERTAKLSKE
ncbi:MAG: rRNA methyltransferase [Deltaproteobacteria bacterium]|nr:MAG: rRNA methyltransferase [Deltaproteobacteria bacterium]